tara:strand:+ start:615 stop:1265 length:651 start_codon:yes stop_codon:yes gene_type:complete
MLFIFLFILLILKKSNSIINIQNFELPLCKNDTFKLGYKTTQYFYNHLFNHNIVLSKDEMNCIMNTPNKMSNIINTCISQLTINNNTIPEKVCQGMALDDNKNWVSACAPNMPCIEFNTYLINGNFTKLLKHCGVENKFKSLLINTDVAKYSILGYEECQLYDPEICIYPEKNKKKYTYYACPVSRWIFISNFILIYFVNPDFAINLPGCRIIFKL